MSRIIFRNIAIGLCAIMIVFILSKTGKAKSAATEGSSHSEIARMKAVLDCTCECGLTLSFCEREDSDCSVRPALLKKLELISDKGKKGMELVRSFMGPMHPVKEKLMETRLRGRHAILFFYQEGSRASDEVKPVLKKGSNIWGDRVKIFQVDIDRKENKQIQQEFRIFATPTLLVIAPNGVVTREFKENITVDKLEGAFASPALARMLKGLQDRRVIFLTIYASDWQNASSVEKTVSMGGEILRTSVRSVHVDPANKEESRLLKMLNVDKNQNQSVTYVISQSGQIGSRFEGPVSRKDLFMAFQKVLAARSGCGGSGSGPGGTTCK